MKIKQIKMGRKKTKINRKKIGIIVGVAVVVIVAFTLIAVQILKGINAWFKVNEFVFNKPVTVTFKRPVEIKEKEIQVAEVIRVIEQIPHPEDLETDVEKLIYDKWGLADYKIAISVAKAESGLRPDAINTNTNGSVDLGLFQINSIHYKKEICSLEKVVTVQGNIDCAYSIWEEQGWTPWVVFQTGAFKNTL